MLPILVELIRHQPVKRLPRDAARHHVIHQPRQVTGQCQGEHRAADHQGRRHRALRPCRDQFRQSQPALEFAELGRNVERRGAAILFGFLRERRVRPRQCRRARRCAAARPRPVFSTSRNTAQSVRRGGSAGLRLVAQESPVDVMAARAQSRGYSRRGGGTGLRATRRLCGAGAANGIYACGNRHCFMAGQSISMTAVLAWALLAVVCDRSVVGALGWLLVVVWRHRGHPACIRRKGRQNALVDRLGRGYNGLSRLV